MIKSISSIEIVQRNNPIPTMKAEWWQIAIGIISLAIITPIGWLCIQMYEMKPTVQSTANRVDRIASVLPEMSRYIAEEEVNANFESLLITEVPTTSIDGSKKLNVHLFDPNTKQHYKYRIVYRNDEEGKSINYKLKGLVYNIDNKARTFEQLEKWSKEANHKPTIPKNVDSNTSFASNKALPKDFKNELQNIGGQPTLSNVSNSVAVDN